MEHTHVATHTQFACHTDTVRESVSCPSFHHRYTGVLIIEPQRSLITLKREREKGLRGETVETDREGRRGSTKTSLIPLLLKY